METVVFNCGCLIIKSAFGDRDILNVHICNSHIKSVQHEFEQLFERISIIQEMEKPK